LRGELFEVDVVGSGSEGVHSQEQLNCAFSGLAVAMALKMAESSIVCPVKAPVPMYTTRLDKPGAIPSAWVMSAFCSVSSQAGGPAKVQVVLWVSTERRVMGTLLVWPTLE
jgi:hypothetical protein